MIRTVIVARVAVMIERLALLDSAPAFLVVAGVKEKRWNCLCVGGRIERVKSLVLPHSMPEEEIHQAAGEMKGLLIGDHNGSSDYKQQVLGVMLKRIGERL